MTRSATFDRLLEVWSGGDPADVLTVITADYAGHMLHLGHGQRSARDYPGWIESFREANPNTRFSLEAGLNRHHLAVCNPLYVRCVRDDLRRRGQDRC